MFAYIACCFCAEGARKPVQLHNIGSMCVTALPTQNLSGLNLSTVITKVFFDMLLNKYNQQPAWKPSEPELGKLPQARGTALH